MRYYSIVLTGAPAAFPAVPGASQPGAQWDTWINGRNDPNAQRVEFSFIQIDHSTDPQKSYLTIHGIPFAQIKQSADIVKCGIKVYGGMKPGLPLATEQSKHLPNVLVEGEVQQAYGNWIGTDMSLTMIIGNASDDGGGGGGPGSNDGGNQDPKGLYPTDPGQGVVTTPSGGGGHAAGPVMASTGPRSISRRGFPVAPSALDAGIGGIAGGLISMLTTGMEQIGGEVFSLFQAGGNIAKPLNLVHNMRPSQLLSEAIRETLQRAFPKAKLDIAISPNLKLGYQDAGMYQSMVQYAGYIKQLSHSILGGGPGGYQGVHITQDGNTIKVKDGTNAGQTDSSGPTQISYIDLIGQPTWVAPSTISIKTVMRGDIKLQQMITLPPTLVTTQMGVAQQIVAGPDSQKLGALSFQGTFQVVEVLHTGDSRNPDPAAWCTTFQCITQNQGQKDATKAATDTASSNNVQTLPGTAQTATAAGMGGGGGVGSHAMSARAVRRY